QEVKKEHEAFWELTGFGFRRNSEVKREGGLEHSQDGNKTMRVWSEPKVDNIVLRWWSGSGK
ncbi:hypothetical protein DVH24_030189, partial [Malus domestica]